MRTHHKLWHVHVIFNLWCYLRKLWAKFKKILDMSREFILEKQIFALHHFIYMYNYNGKLRKPIIKCNCDNNVAWSLMLQWYFTFKISLRNSMRVQNLMRWSSKIFLIAVLSEKGSLEFRILNVLRVFRSLITLASRT